METAISGFQMLVALGIGLLVLILLILKSKLHVFIALIVSACLIGIIGGMNPITVVSTITQGFGGTLGSIGIIIGMGVMMGRIFEISGAAERMARTFLKLFGKNKEEYAMGLTGFLVSIPIFCDSGFVILSPLAKAISKRTKISIVSLSVALAAGLVITHSLVPPTPGPLGVAGTFNIDVGKFLLLNICVALPMAFGCILYGKKVGKDLYQIPGDDQNWLRPDYQERVEDSASFSKSVKMPSTFMAFFPLLLPIVLILLNTILSATGMKTGFAGILIFLGQPIVAVGLGLILSIYLLTPDLTQKDVISQLEESIKAAGIIILVTGGGGALGQIIKTAGVGNYIASGIAATPIPVILLPFIIATLVRFVQGSGTVAMLTAAGITAPIVEASGGNMLLGALAACIGSLFFSYFNDSFFWVVTRLSGIDNAKEQVRMWSVTTTIAWAIGLVELLILNIFM